MKRPSIPYSLIGLVVLLAVLSAVVIPTPKLFAQAQGMISSPRDRASVRGLVPVEGSTTHPQFQKYELHYGPEPNPNDQWSPVGGSPFTVQVVQGRLALWDTTIIPDGLYSLRLRVVRLDGNYDEYVVRGIQVVNALPTETPTPAVTATPVPPTLTPSPTPTIIIGVPTVSSPTPKPSDTPPPTAPPTATPEELGLPFQNINDAARWGTLGTLAAFLAVGLVFALKGGLAAGWRWLVRRGREGLGRYED